VLTLIPQSCEKTDTYLLGFSTVQVLINTNAVNPDIETLKTAQNVCMKSCENYRL